MKYRPPIRGKALKKKSDPIQVPDTIGDIEGLVQVVDELTTLNKDNFENLETDLLTTIDQKLIEVDVAIGEMKALEPIPGKDADEEMIIERVLEKIPIPENGKDAEPLDQESIIAEVLLKIPEQKPFDEKKIIKKIIASLPEKKGTLKIIRETIETDPMSIVERILALPADKFKLKSENIDGLEQTISAFKNQIGVRGYVHGGGISDITGLIQAGTNITLTGNGTKTNPYIINATGGSMSPLTTKGDLYTYSTMDDRLPVGTDGYFLSANSATTTGLEWITAPNSMAIGNPVIGGSANSILYVDPSGNLSQSTDYFIFNESNGHVGIGNNTANELLTLGTTSSLKGILSVAGSTSGKVIIQPANAAGTWTWTIPTTAGTNGFPMITNGSGVSSWAALSLAGTAVTGTLPITKGGTGTGTTFTAGSIIFAGVGGAYNQNNAKLFWNNSTETLCIGTTTTTTGAILTVAGSIATSGTIFFTNNGLATLLKISDQATANTNGTYFVFQAGKHNGTGVDGKVSIQDPTTTNRAFFDTSSLTADRTFTFPDASGTFALTSSLSGYVPYTGATTNVDLGTHNLTVDTTTFFVNAINHRVGIGTVTPSYPLDVLGQIRGVSDSGAVIVQPDTTPNAQVGGIVWNNANGGLRATLNINEQSGEMRWYISNGGYFPTFYSNNAEAMRIDTSGKLGIGTTTISAMVHIISTTEQLRIGYDASNYFNATVGSTGLVTFDGAGANAEFVFNKKVGINGNPTADLHLFSTSTPMFTIETLTANDNTQVKQMPDGSGNAYWDNAGVGTQSRFRVSGASALDTTALVIDSSGMVGIGTNAPSAILHVYKDVDAASSMIFENPNSGGSAYAGVQLKGDVDSSYIYRASSGYTGGATPNALYIQNQGGDIVFYTSGSGESLRIINSSGNSKFTGDINFTDGVDRTIKINDQTVTDTDGNKLYIYSGAGNGTGNGGDLVLTAGAGSVNGNVVIGGTEINVRSTGSNSYISIQGLGPCIVDGATNYRAVLIPTSLSNTQNFTFPDASGTFALETGVSDTFTTVDLKTVTVVNGIITSIV